jgi:hypothetical protein
MCSRYCLHCDSSCVWCIVCAVHRVSGASCAWCIVCAVHRVSGASCVWCIVCLVHRVSGASYVSNHSLSVPVLFRSLFGCLLCLQTRTLHFGHVARSFALTEAPSTLVSSRNCARKTRCTVTWAAANVLPPCLCVCVWQGSKKSAGVDKKRKVTETPAAKKRARENRKQLVSGISEFM